MALAERSEVKETLTEHLYTVIQQNETRKAEHLAALMGRLGMEGGQRSATLALPPPQLLSFAPINTLHRPAQPPAFPPTPTSSAPTSPQASCSSVLAACPPAPRPPEGEALQAILGQAAAQHRLNAEASLAAWMDEEDWEDHSVVASCSSSSCKVAGEDGEREKEGEDGAEAENEEESSPPAENGSPESQDG